MSQTHCETESGGEEEEVAQDPKIILKSKSFLSFLSSESRVEETSPRLLIPTAHHAQTHVRSVGKAPSRAGRGTAGSHQGSSEEELSQPLLAPELLSVPAQPTNSGWKLDWNSFGFSEGEGGGHFLRASSF